MSEIKNNAKVFANVNPKGKTVDVISLKGLIKFVKDRPNDAELGKDLRKLLNIK